MKFLVSWQCVCHEQEVVEANSREEAEAKLEQMWEDDELDILQADTEFSITESEEYPE